MSTIEQAVFDPSLGLLRASRRQLSRLVELAAGAPGGPGDRELSRHGLLCAGRPHKLLQPPLGVIAEAHSRFWLRRWERNRMTLLEGLVGPAGIVLLPGGSDPDVLQDVRHHIRDTALARVLATLLRLQPATAAVELPRDDLDWSEVRSLAADPAPPWVHDLWNSSGGKCSTPRARLYDLIWQPSIGGPRGSVLVLADLGPAGLAEVESAGSKGRYTLEPRSPAMIWYGLCRLLSYPS